MHKDTGPNTEPETPETPHPDTGEPRPQQAGQEAEGGGGGAAEAPPRPPNHFEDLLRQMQEMAGGGSPASSPTSDADRRRYMRANLMGQVMGLLPQLIDYISMASEEASEEEHPGAEEAEEPVAEYIPADLPVGFGLRPFDVESVLFGEQVKQKQQSARDHGFNLGLGLGSAMMAMGANALVREVIWNISELSTDLGSVINATFGKNRMQQAMLHRERAAAPQVDPRDMIHFPSVGEYFRTSGPRPGPRAPNPAVGLKYGASFPGEYECAEEAPADEAPAAELPDFEGFLRRMAALKTKVDAGAIEAHPEIKDVFSNFGEIFKRLFPCASEDPAEGSAK